MLKQRLGSPAAPGAALTGVTTIGVILFSVAGWATFAQSGNTVLQSPDGKLAISFQTVAVSEPGPGSRGTVRTVEPAPAGQLVYEVSFQGKPLVESSVLGLELEGQPLLGANVRLASATRSQTDETYGLVTGKASSVRDHYNALRVELEEVGPPGRKFAVEARAYDDAVAFRYAVPEQAGLREFRLTKENTEFRFVKDPTVYAQILPSYRSGYENEYVKLTVSALGDFGGGGQGVPRSSVTVGLPLLLEVPGIAWMAIMEADLKGYSSLYLSNPADTWGGRWLEARVAPQLENPAMAVAGGLPAHSAWRALLVADDPGRFIESNILTSLNPKSRVEDTSWIRAGRAAWNWWGGSLDADGKRAFTTENMKYYVDFASRSGFEYMLVDAGWSAPNDVTSMNGRVDIPELVRHAADKNVKIWIWVHSNALMKQMDEAFPVYEKWGVAGVKTDFLLRDDQEGMAFYYRSAEKAAEHHLMIDYHGCTKPSGLNRTYPNVFGYEGVIGMERSKAGARDNPDSHVMLPFTRMLAGQMDYTPGGFENVTREEFVARGSDPMVMGTRAHHLAMYVVYEVPFQMVSDHPSAYAGQPSFEFIKAAPATWDETRVLNGEVGEYITIARRHGKEWFLGSMTNWTPRQVEIPLTFLGPGRFTAEVYADAADAAAAPKHVTIEKRNVNADTKLKLDMAPGGGCAIRFRPAN